jgi:hypothetical protein
MALADRAHSAKVLQRRAFGGYFSQAGGEFRFAFSPFGIGTYRDRRALAVRIWNILWSTRKQIGIR